MRGYRILVIGFAVVCAGLVAPTAANAEDYPPPAVDAPPRAVAGSAVTVTGTGFKPFSVVKVCVDYSSANSGASLRTDHAGSVTLAGFGVLPRKPVCLWTATADANGAFSLSVMLTEAGIATLTSTGIDPLGNARQVSTTVVVSASISNNSAGGGGSNLPVTGVDGSKLAMNVGLGAGGVVFGAVLIGLTVVWRRRNARTM